mmetsp:Transcript_9224/g.37950  ORF Transcript_9224/g.37950 Transcript_9224/m.37950 type:complete len:753 (+) Transcript_9224:1411-3669(+)
MLEGTELLAEADDELLVDAGALLAGADADVVVAILSLLLLSLGLLGLLGGLNCVARAVVVVGRDLLAALVRLLLLLCGRGAALLREAVEGSGGEALVEVVLHARVRSLAHGQEQGGNEAARQHRLQRPCADVVLLRQRLAVVEAHGDGVVAVAVAGGRLHERLAHLDARQQLWQAQFVQGGGQVVGVVQRGAGQQRQRHGGRADVLAGRHHYLGKARDTQRDVGLSVAGKMEGVERHLRARLSDGLASNDAHRLARLHQALVELEEHQCLESVRRELARPEGGGQLVPVREPAVGIVRNVRAQLAVEGVAHHAQVGGGVQLLEGQLDGGVVGLLGQAAVEGVHRLGGLEYVARDRLIDVVGLEEGLAVARLELELREELGVARVDAVLAVAELDDGAVRVAHSVVVLHHQALEVLDEAALEVSGLARLHRGIDQALAACHAVEEELLRPDARQVAVAHVAACPGAAVARLKARQGLAARHHRHAPALQHLLAEEARDVALVHFAALGARHGHEREEVVGEALAEAVREALADDVRREGIERLLHHGIQACVVLVRLELLAERGLQAGLVAGKRVCPHVLLTQVDVLGCHLAAGALCLLQLALAELRALGSEEQVVDAAREAVRAEVDCQEPAERREEGACHGGAEDLKARVHEAVGGRADLALVQHTGEELAVADDHLSLARALAPELLAYCVLGVHVELEALAVGVRQVLEHNGEDLLARPERLRLEDAGHWRADGLVRLDVAAGGVDQLL